MSPQEVSQFVAANRFGMLGLAAGGRAYVLPLFYGYDGASVYFNTHPGLKMRYLEETEEACFTIARVVSYDDWGSVEMFGRVDEVRDGPALTAGLNALMSVPLPPEWGLSEMGEPRRGDVGTHVLRLKPRAITGRKSVPPTGGEHAREMSFSGM